MATLMVTPTAPDGPADVEKAAAGTGFLTWLGRVWAIVFIVGSNHLSEAVSQCGASTSECNDRMTILSVARAG